MGRDTMEFEFVLRGFKNFESICFRLQSGLTFLIGPNGAGKSNLLEAIQLLSVLVRGAPLHEIRDVGRGGLFNVRGGLAACSRNGGQDFHLFVKHTPAFSRDDQTDSVLSQSDSSLRYSLGLAPLGEPRIFEENLHQEKTLIFESIADSLSNRTIDFRFNNFKRGGMEKKPQQTFPDNRTILSRYETVDVDIAERQKWDKKVEAFRNALGACASFNPNPALMRTYVARTGSELASDGSNLSGVLWALRAASTPADDRLKRITENIRQIPDADYDAIDFLEAPTGEVLLTLRAGDYKTDARVLSDGTLRALAILTAAETVTAGSILLIEEFDNGLHPSRVQILSNALREAALRRGLFLVVTTHNPATLNKVQPADFSRVWALYYDKTSAASQLRSLADIDFIEELRQQGRLGDLVSDRILDRYLEPDFAEKLTERRLAWLNSLNG